MSLSLHRTHKVDKKDGSILLHSPYHVWCCCIFIKYTQQLNFVHECCSSVILLMDSEPNPPTFPYACQKWGRVLHLWDVIAQVSVRAVTGNKALPCQMALPACASRLHTYPRGPSPNLRLSAVYRSGKQMVLLLIDKDVCKERRVEMAFLKTVVLQWNSHCTNIP